MSDQTTLKDVQALIAREEAELAALRVRREQLSGELDALAESIVALKGGAPAPGAGRPEPKAGGGHAKPAPAAGRKAGMTLKDAVASILLAADAPLRAPDIAAQLRDVGYESKSKAPAGMVSTLLGQDEAFKRVSRGLYEQAKAGGRHEEGYGQEEGGGRRKTGKKTAKKTSGSTDLASLSLSDAILQVLKQSDEPMAPAQIVEALKAGGVEVKGKRPAQIVSMTLGRMKGKVTKGGDGRCAV